MGTGTGTTGTGWGWGQILVPMQLSSLIGTTRYRPRCRGPTYWPLNERCYLRQEGNLLPGV